MMEIVGFVALILVGLSLALNGVLFLLAAAAGFGSKTETTVGLVIGGLGAWLLYFSYMNAPFKIIAA